MLPTILIVAILLLAASVASAMTGCSRFVRSDSPVRVDPTVSSVVVSEPSSASVDDCLLSCWLRGCVAVSLQRSSRVCQLLFINDASRSPGPLESHAWRSLGSEADAEVWKASDIDRVIELRRLNIIIDFTNSSTGRNGSIQQLSINLTGCYRIDAWGAAGGSNNFTGTAGGSGAFKSGRFNLTAGVQLSVLVGQAGGPAVDGNCGGGGGGGSFVFNGSDNRHLLSAGGGGGAAFSKPGVAGQKEMNGTDSFGGEALLGFGGSFGHPGFNDPSKTIKFCNHGGCGAGWLGGASTSRRSAADGAGGCGFSDSWLGGLAGSGSLGDGGFGGGGGAGGSANNRTGAGGGGGGYSGGGAGLGVNHSGGGGGSACDGIDCVGVTGGNSLSLQGRVLVKFLSFVC